MTFYKRVIVSIGGKFWTGREWSENPAEAKGYQRHGHAATALWHLEKSYGAGCATVQMNRRTKED